MFKPRKDRRYLSVAQDSKLLRNTFLLAKNTAPNLCNFTYSQALSITHLNDLPVGSSARISDGSFTIARAIATRCFCPRDSLLTGFQASSSSSTDMSASSAGSRRFDFFLPRKIERKHYIFERRNILLQREMPHFHTNLLAAKCAQSSAFSPNAVSTSVTMSDIVALNFNPRPPQRATLVL